MDDDEESESGSSSELELVAGANHSHVGHISLWNVLDPYMRTTECCKLVYIRATTVLHRVIGVTEGSPLQFQDAALSPLVTYLQG